MPTRPTAVNLIKARPTPTVSLTKTRTAVVPAVAPPGRARRTGRRWTVRPVAARARTWAGAPTGALVVAGVVLAVLLAGAGSAGAYLVPLAGGSTGQASTELDPGRIDRDLVGTDLAGGSSPDGADPALDEFPTDPVDPLPGGTGTPRPISPGGGGGQQLGQVPGAAGPRSNRPADALTAWAATLAGRLGIPPVALQAYGYAEIVAARTIASCHLSWTMLAGIGKIESNHGQTGGSRLGADGKSLPTIIGAALDGQAGRDAIADTDGGRLDNNRVWDHAVGPMQFIPTTWQRYATDADNDGSADPNDIDDAALAAATYLCAGGRDLSTGSGWYSAVLSYNEVRVYAANVYAAANDYGQRSRA